MKGIEENSPSLNPEMKGTRGASPKTKSRNLLDRFNRIQRTDSEIPDRLESSILRIIRQKEISG